MPPQTSWNRGDCGASRSSVAESQTRPPQTSWNRGDCGITNLVNEEHSIDRLRLLGIAVTAAFGKIFPITGLGPPQTSWNRGDCGKANDLRPSTGITASDFLESR